MKKHYATPTLKVVEFKAEQGFATSSGKFTIVDNIFTMEFDEDGPCNEAYTFQDDNSYWN